MKRHLVAASLAAILCIGSALAKVVNVSCDTGSTTCTVISNSSTQSISIAQMILSVSTGDNLTLKCGSTTMIGPLYLGATSGLTQDFKLQNRAYSEVCAPGNNVTVTKGTASTPLTVWMDYDQ